MGNKSWGTTNISTIVPDFGVGNLLQNGRHGSIIFKSERNELRFIGILGAEQCAAHSEY